MIIMPRWTMINTEMITVYKTMIIIILMFRLRELSMLKFPGTVDEVSLRSKQLDCLQIALRTQPHSFVSRFIEVSTLFFLFILLYIFLHFLSVIFLIHSSVHWTSHFLQCTRTTRPHLSGRVVQSL